MEKSYLYLYLCIIQLWGCQTFSPRNLPLERRYSHESLPMKHNSIGKNKFLYVGYLTPCKLFEMRKYKSLCLTIPSRCILLIHKKHNKYRDSLTPKCYIHCFGSSFRFRFCEDIISVTNQPLYLFIILTSIGKRKI